MLPSSIPRRRRPHEQISRGSCRNRDWSALRCGSVADRAGYARLVGDYEPVIERLRVTAQANGAAPVAMEPYLEKVRHGAYRITDEDVEELRAVGLSEDEIFEQTVSVAVSEGLLRLDAALRALG